MVHDEKQNEKHAENQFFRSLLVNLVTLDDVVFDVAVRYQNLIPDLCLREDCETDPYKPGKFNISYKANFKSDIEPIIRRPLDYLWVANIPVLAAFASPPFNPRDASDANRKNREEYVRYFRKPGWGEDSQRNQLFLNSAQGQPLIPLMPLNSGSNSVRTNPFIDKFLTLTETQYFLLQQWANGKFSVDEQPEIDNIHPLDRANLGNCVGAPMCPGIEVTWNFRNPTIYCLAYQIRHAHEEAYYKSHVSFAKTQSVPPRSDDRSLGLAFHSEELNLIYVRMEKSAAEVTMTEHARRRSICLPNE